MRVGLRSILVYHQGKNDGAKAFHRGNNDFANDVSDRVLLIKKFQATDRQTIDARI